MTQIKPDEYGQLQPSRVHVPKAVTGRALLWSMTIGMIIASGVATVKAGIAQGRGPSTLPRIIRWSATTVASEHIHVAGAPDVPTIQLKVTLPPPPPVHQQRSLVIPFNERRAGNAAVDYLRALTVLPQLPREAAEVEKRQRELDEWLTVPLARLPLKQVQARCEEYAAAVFALQTGARRRYCDWQLDEYLDPEQTAFLLESSANYRHLLHIVRLRLRSHLARGDLEAAWQDWQTGLQFSRDVAQSPTVIRMLTGIALQTQMLHVAHDWMQHPKCFNLYPAFISLPRPLFDPAIALEGEAAFIRRSLPQPPELEQKVLSPPEALRLLTVCYGSVSRTQSTGPLVGVALAGYAAQQAPAARTELMQLGLDPKRVERLPDAQVVALRNVLLMRGLWNEVVQLFQLPYYRTQPVVLRLERKLTELTQRQDLVLTLYSQSVKSILKTYHAFHRLERLRALLQAVEAIRLYAFHHKGLLPENLEQITTVDVPQDPWTGKAFLYQRTANGFKLTALPEPPDTPQSGSSWTYEVVIV
ncbi:MAG: hypothetical protein NZ703_10695, partial [Gemmataceae bacterium]|nr:hypothetical protein [Gemmataceae bacterium]